MATETITHSIDAPEKALGMDHDPDPEIPAKARRRQYSARYKAETLAAYDKLAKNERGAFLRREGLYSSNITEWRHQRDRGALEALAKPAGRPAADPRDREVAALRKENERLQPRTRQGPQGHRDPGKTLGAVGAARHRQRRADRRDEMTDMAIAALAPVVGTRAACAALGEPRARYYRRHRQSPAAEPPLTIRRLRSRAAAVPA